MLNSLLLFWSDAKDELPALMLWLSLAVVVLLVAAGVLVALLNKDTGRYIRGAFAFAVGFAVCVAVTLLAANILAMREKDRIFPFVFWPIVAAAAVIILGGAAVYLATFFSKKALKVTGLTVLALFAAAAVAVIVCLMIYLANGEAESNNGVTITLGENIALYVSAAVLIAVLFVFYFVGGKNDAKGFDSKSISYAAVCIAMSFALSYIKFFSMPKGGSVTFASLLPLIIYSYMFGVKKGVLAGVVYGFLQAIQEPWLIHPAQFLLDYPVAFAMIGVAGLFAKQKWEAPAKFVAGTVLAAVLRYAAHVLSGMFAFAPEGENALIYSLGYNSFVFMDIAITIVAGVFVFMSQSFVRMTEKYNR